MIQPVLADVELLEAGLTAPLPDGRRAYYNYYWLRDNCPSSFDSTTRERNFDIFELAEPPRPAAATLSSAGLAIRWAGDDHESLYPFEWLAPYAEGDQRPDPAALTRRPWRADHYPAATRVAHPTLLEDPAEQLRFAEALLVDGLAFVTDMPDTDEALTRTANVIGEVRPTFFGAYFDVRVHIEPTNLAYTSAALELHTDVPAEDEAPGIQFLHCRANSVVGGDNLFLDGAAVAEDLRLEDPDAFRLLSETDIPYYNEHDGWDMRSRQRVIELDEQGAVSGVTISQHMADIFDLPQRFLDRYYPAFVKFGQMLQREKYVMRFNIRAGECVVFDNHRIVHGRAAYSATSGARYLRGCYTDRGELRSKYRALTTVGRFKDKSA